MYGQRLWSNGDETCDRLVACAFVLEVSPGPSTRGQENPVPKGSGCGVVVLMKSWQFRCGWGCRLFRGGSQALSSRLNLFWVG